MVCDICGKTFKNTAGLKAHHRFKHPAGLLEAPEMMTLAYHEGPRNYRTFPALRRHKMGRPACVECQSPERRRPRWWLDCPHDPYFHDTEETSIIRQYAEGEAVPGEARLVTGKTEEIREMRAPNLSQVSLSPRHNGTVAYDLIQAKGYVEPEALGFYPFCDFIDCWIQRGLKQYAHGRYCTEQQARLIKLDEAGTTIEVFDTERQIEQLKAVAL